MQVISKTTHKVILETEVTHIRLSENSVVVLDLSRDEIESILREGTSAIIVLKNGEKIIIENFFAENSDHEIVLKEDIRLYHAEFTTDGQFIRYDLLNDIEPLLYSDPLKAALPWIGGALGVGALAAAIGGGGGGGKSSDPAPTAKIKITSISPDSGLDSSDFITNAQNITLNGTLSEPLTSDDRAQISLDGGATWQDLTVDSNGNWSYTDTRTLTDGTYDYQVRVVDSAGQVGSTDSQTVTVDTIPPDATDYEISITGISDDTGIDQQDFLTTDNTLTIHGVVSQALAAGDVAQISIDGGATWQNLTLNAQGEWHYVDNRVLNDGQYTYDVRVVDQAGNVGSTASQTVTVDSEGPDLNKIIEILSITDDSGLSPNDFITSDTSLTIRGHLSQPLLADEFTQISIDGGVTWSNLSVNGVGDWAYVDTRILEDRQYVYQVRVVDEAGNVGSTDSKTVTVDTQAPDATTNKIEIKAIVEDTGVSNSDFITQRTSFAVNGTLTGTLQTDEVAQISIDGGNTWIDLTVANGQWSYVDTRTLTDGAYTYRVRVVDLAGNVGSTDSQVVRVDTLPPDPTSHTITIESISEDSGLDNNDFVTNDKSLTVSGKLTGVLASGEYAQISIDEQNWVNLAIDNNGNWTYVDSRLLNDGTHTYYVRVIDTAGNVGSTAEQDVTIDTTAPDTTLKAIRITAISDDTGASNSDFVTQDREITISGTLTGTLAADEYAQISRDGGASWQDVTINGDQWSFTDPDTLPDGEYNYLVRVVDKAGNVGSTHSQLVKIDGTAPDATNKTITITAISDDTGLSNADFITNDKSLTIHGTLKNGNSAAILASDEYAQISIDSGQNWINISINSLGNWSYVDTRTLLDGDHKYLVRVVTKQVMWGRPMSKLLKSILLHRVRLTM